nr:Chain O, uL24m [Leishmania major]
GCVRVRTGCRIRCVRASFTYTQAQMYARYRTRSRFYKRPEKMLKAYNVSPNLLRLPKVKPGLLKGIYTDEKIDLRDRERLELVESIRHPKERDFYQDHTYHNQWIARDLESHQKIQIAGRYPYFSPDYEIKPWIWYPGDTVEVVSGEGAGQRGAIIAVVKYKNEILVQNVNVQDVVIPASETRPEQVVQREHPISVLRVRHVDPSTNQLCHLEIVKVRNKETGELEERRISLESGALLPIPAPEETVEAGDPLKDTAIQDADEETYDREKEMPLLVVRRLQAMENYFVDSLQKSHEYHKALQMRNAQDMQTFQKDVLVRATEKLAAAAAVAGHGAMAEAGSQAASVATESSQAGDAEEDAVKGTITVETVVAEVLKSEQRFRSDAAAPGVPGWWQNMIDAYVSVLEEEEATIEAEAAAQAQAAEADRRAEQLMADATAEAGQSMEEDGTMEGGDEDLDEQDGDLDEDASRSDRSK